MSPPQQVEITKRKARGKVGNESIMITGWIAYWRNFRDFIIQSTEIVQIILPLKINQVNCDMSKLII